MVFDATDRQSMQVECSAVCKSSHAMKTVIESTTSVSHFYALRLTRSHGRKYRGNRYVYLKCDLYWNITKKYLPYKTAIIIFSLVYNHTLPEFFGGVKTSQGKDHGRVRNIKEREREREETTYIIPVL